jgi:hypothetical protein
MLPLHPDGSSVLPTPGPECGQALGPAVSAQLPAGRPALIAPRRVPAGAGRVRDHRDRLTGELIMAGLLPIDVAVCSALIIVAALIVIRRRRRSSGQPPAPASGREAAAGLAGEAMVQRQIAIVPGFSDTVPPEPGTHVPVQPVHPVQPAQPVQAAQPMQATQSVQSVQSVQAAQPVQAAHLSARPAADPQPDPHGPGPQPNGQRSTVGAVTASEQIASYYDQADKPIADYLTVLGWTRRPPHSPEPPGSAGRARRHPPQSGGRGQ